MAWHLIATPECKNQHTLSLLGWGAPRKILPVGCGDQAKTLQAKSMTARARRFTSSGRSRHRCGWDSSAAEPGDVRVFNTRSWTDARAACSPAQMFPSEMVQLDQRRHVKKTHESAFSGRRFLSSFSYSGFPFFFDKLSLSGSTPTLLGGPGSDYRLLRHGGDHRHFRVAWADER